MTGNGAFRKPFASTAALLAGANPSLGSLSSALLTVNLVPGQSIHRNGRIRTRVLPRKGRANYVAIRSPAPFAELRDGGSMELERSRDLEKQSPLMDSEGKKAVAIYNITTVDSKPRDRGTTIGRDDSLTLINDKLCRYTKTYRYRRAKRRRQNISCPQIHPVLSDLSLGQAKPHKKSSTLRRQKQSSPLPLAPPVLRFAEEKATSKEVPLYNLIPRPKQNYTARKEGEFRMKLRLYDDRATAMESLGKIKGDSAVNDAIVTGEKSRILRGYFEEIILSHGETQPSPRSQQVSFPGVKRPADDNKKAEAIIVNASENLLGSRMLCANVRAEFFEKAGGGVGKMILVELKDYTTRMERVRKHIEGSEAAKVEGYLLGESLKRRVLGQLLMISTSRFEEQLQQQWDPGEFDRKVSDLTKLLDVVPELADTLVVFPSANAGPFAAHNKRCRSDVRAKLEARPAPDANLLAFAMKKKKYVLLAHHTKVSSFASVDDNSIVNCVEILGEKRHRNAIKYGSSSPRKLRPPIITERDRPSLKEPPCLVLSKSFATKRTSGHHKSRRVKLLPLQRKKRSVGEEEEAVVITLGDGTSLRILPAEKLGAAEDLDALACVLGNKVSLHPCQTANSPAKISLYHEPDTHLWTHPINKLLVCANQFILTVFKSKDPPTAASQKVIARLAQVLGISIPQKNVFEQQTDLQRVFRGKENAQNVKERLQRILNSLVNRQNEVDLICGSASEKFQPYKFYICRGNNGAMVRSVLKRRWWWTAGTRDDEGINLVWTQWCSKSFVSKLGRASEMTSSRTEPTQAKMCNHLEGHFHLSNKKAMFLNVRQYYLRTSQDPFATLPLTFHIRHGVSDPEFAKFCTYYNSLEANRSKFAQKDHANVWIVKPGENSNRGNGIQVLHDLEDITRAVNGGLVSVPAAPLREDKPTYILQKYIEHPLLISKRKFDIRMYGLITSVNGYLKGYFYGEGYVRTASKEFTLKNLSNKIIHLTNDAVQKNTEDYGKYETGNKLSFGDLQKYLDSAFPELGVDFSRDLLPQIKKIVADTFRAVYPIVDPNRRLHCFEIFGYDFMLDRDFRVYLIEVNTNPCLEASCPLLGRLLPVMIDNVFRLAVDPVFQPGEGSRRGDISWTENEFELVFDERIDGPGLREILASEREIGRE